MDMVMSIRRKRMGVGRRTVLLIFQAAAKVARVVHVERYAVHRHVQQKVV